MSTKSTKPHQWDEYASFLGFQTEEDMWLGLFHYLRLRTRQVAELLGLLPVEVSRRLQRKGISVIPEQPLKNKELIRLIRFAAALHKKPLRSGVTPEQIAEAVDKAMGDLTDG